MLSWNGLTLFWPYGLTSFLFSVWNIHLDCFHMAIFFIIQVSLSILTSKDAVFACCVEQLNWTHNLTSHYVTLPSYWFVYGSHSLPSSIQHPECARSTTGPLCIPDTKVCAWCIKKHIHSNNHYVFEWLNEKRPLHNCLKSPSWSLDGFCFKWTNWKHQPDNQDNSNDSWIFDAMKVSITILNLMMAFLLLWNFRGIVKHLWKHLQGK